ncbi:MAG: hypothetical protein HFG93_01755 [Dorea sp.]|nr:hypothetical protein [Dorea sp.]
MGKGSKLSIRERAGAEKQKIQGMTRDKAAQYIWTYYKIPIVGAAVLIFLAVYFIRAFLNRPEDALLHVTFVNCYDDVSENSDFYKDFLAYAELEDTGEVIFDSNVFFDLSKDSDYANTYFQKTVAYLEAGTTDALICQETNMRGMAKGGRVLSLKDVRAAEIYEKYKDRVVDYTTKEGEVVPVGIDISDSPRLKGMKSYKNEEGCYLCVSAYIDNADQAAIFLDYLLSE